MAIMIPETLNGLANVTKGETRVFRLLQQKLDDENVVWFNIPIRRRYADFIIFSPAIGLLVLEVKGWPLASIKAANPAQITLQTEQGEKTVINPLQQARDYTLQIVDLLKADPLLIQPVGPFRGNLSFPFSYGVIWTKISRIDFQRSLKEVFDAKLMIFGDDINAALSSGELIKKFSAMLPQRFNFELKRAQLDHIRYHIFPEIRLPGKQAIARPREQPLQAEIPGLATDSILTVMDLEQERLAKNLGGGHRLLRGVAGSGKTWTLVCRARILAQLHPDWKILVVCYNVSLATLLEQMIGNMDIPGYRGNIRVVNYHRFLFEMAEAAGIVKSSSSDWAEALSQVLCRQAATGRWQPPVFDAILIDEAHDFHTDWLRLVVACLNSHTESLFIVHDSAQNIYRKGFSFKKVGINIKGRTRVLRTNYRNTHEIAELAARFLSFGVSYTESNELRNDEGQLLEIIRPQSTLRSGPVPQLIACQSYREECAEAAARVKRWLERGDYPAQEIVVLYVKRGSTAEDDRYIQALLTSLSEAGVPHEWISRDRLSKRSFRLDAPTVKVSTIHSAKGLDFAAVIMVGIAMLPSSDEQADKERKLVYVGLTRARNELIITYCKASAFILDLKRCLASR